MAEKTFALDKKTILNLQRLYPNFALRLVPVYFEMFGRHGYKMGVNQGLRTWEEQAELYKHGRNGDKRDVVTNARPGYSYHQFGVGADHIFMGGDAYLAKLGNKKAKAWFKTFGEIGEEKGLVWGGDWDGDNIEDKNDYDSPHLESHYGMLLSRMRTLYANGGLAGVWDGFDKLRKVPKGQEWNSDFTKKKMAALGKLT